MVTDQDKVFKALADPSRRKLLDRLRKESGLTLSELCEKHTMSRQAVTKHLVLLEAANLVVTTKQGREKLHYLNPMPINDIYMRWIGKFEQQRVSALYNLKQALEEKKIMSEFIYTIYIKTTPEKVWAAITNPEFCRQYWGHENISDWKTGSPWSMHAADDSTNVKTGGKVIESNPPTRLVLTWAKPDNKADESQLVYDISVIGDMVRLDVIHTQLSADMARGVSMGWPRVLSSMKSYLETGKPLDTWTGMSNCGQAA